MEHTWTFFATNAGSDDRRIPVVVTVCTRCGLARAATTPRDRDTMLDLSGDCEPEQRPSADETGRGLEV